LYVVGGERASGYCRFVMPPVPRRRLEHSRDIT
jgi:hypothetical protein